MLHLLRSCLCMLLGIGALAAGVAGMQPPSGQEPDLDKLRADLQRPGPEGRREREAAVVELLSLRDAGAHRMLLDVLAGEDDPDGLLRFVLEQSGRALANRRNEVFYPAAERRAQQAPLRRSYGVAFVRRYAGSSAAEASGGPVRVLARSALLGMEEADLIALLRDLLAGAVDADRIATCMAIADLQSLTLAPLLADQLEDPKLGKTAREALGQLTFRSDGFASKGEFERWRAENNGITYLELAERAAREAMQRSRERRAADEARILLLQQQLVGALASRPDVPWQSILTLLQEDSPPGSRLQCLGRLRDVLVAADRATPGGPDAERAAMLEYLSQRMKDAVNGNEYPLLLEVSAQLVDGSSAEARVRVVDALVKGLASTAPAVRLAALRGLRRHPSPENRHAVVTLLSDPRVQVDPELLGVLLGTLQAKGWNAPQAGAADNQLWVAGLQRLIANKGLKKELRDAALQALSLRDRDQQPVAAAFPAFVELVSDAALDPELREKAMIALEAHAADPTHWDRYVALLLAGLSDAKDRVRQRAAMLLQRLPPAPSPEKLAEADTQVLRAVRDRLLIEPDERAFKALLECLRRRFDAQRDPTPVLIPLIRALEELAQAPGQPGVAFRREPIVQLLNSLVVQPGVPTIHWVRALEALAGLNDRTSMRFVLERQAAYLAGTVPAAADAAETFRRAQRMLVSAALLKPAAEVWSALTDEARDVARAFTVLEQPLPGGGKVEEPTPAEFVLRLEVLNATGQYQRTAELARAHLQQGRSADDGTRGKVARLAAEALLQLKQPAEAAKLIESVPAAGTENGGPRLREEIGRALLQGGGAAEAMALLEPLLSQTPPTDPSYTVRLLLCAEAVAGAKPERGGEVLGWLQREQGRFAAETTPVELRERYEALLKKLQG